jgi:serine/threonine protein kinase
MTELHAVAQELAQATTYTDIFPDDPAAIKDTFRRLARILHPDQYQGPDRKIAAEAFKVLGDLHRKAQNPVLATIRTKLGVHEVEMPIKVEADLTETYRANSRMRLGTPVDTLIKVAKSPRDNDLLTAEAKALKALHGAGNEWTRHYPDLIDTFIYPAGRRRANALRWYNGMFTLREIHDMFPTGLDPRHAAWIWRRLLMALGNAHDQGILHGAVLPPHILIGPPDHAVMLIDWCYSAMADDDGLGYIAWPEIKAAVPAYRAGGWYPAEILQKQPPSPSTDLWMAAKTMMKLLENGTIRPMKAYFKGCLLEKQQNRPQNAWILLKEFDELLERIGEPFHPRRFVEFAVPRGVA